MQQKPPWLLCPFARSLQMAYCAAIGDSPLLTVLCVAPGANREPEDGDDATQGEHGGIYAIDPVAPSNQG